jgi:NADH-quinone oxidoreductase subunit M
MPNESNLLPWIIVIPLIGAILTLLGSSKSPQSAGKMALLFSLVPLFLVFLALGSFNFQTGAIWQLTYERAWLSSGPAGEAGHHLGVSFSLGADAISLWLIVLTAVLTPISILASFKYIKDRQSEFYAWMLVLHAGMLGVFCARDILLFYLFFEFTLIPMFFIIGIWGGAERRKAAGKFFLFTFAGSVLTLTALLYMAFLNSSLSHTPLTFSLDSLTQFGHSSLFASHHTTLFGTSYRTEYLIFLGLLAGFSVKVPLFPVHTWLPLAHTEAPTAGSVILAGVLLKLGTYGILRFMVPVLPDATMHYAPAIAVICIIGIIYGALVSWVQGDMKKLIAYSSVSHLGFCVLGMFALTPEGLTGSVMYMINHGLSTGALFLVVGMIYERYHTRDMEQISGLARRLPALAFFAVFFVVSSVALPGLNGFVSEFLVLLGTYISGSAASPGPLGPKFAVFAATGVILGAVYMLYWAGRVIYGPLREPAHDDSHGHHAVQDLSAREWAVLTPLAALIVVLGLFPGVVLNSLQPAVKNISEQAQATAVLPPAPVAQLNALPESRAGL